MSIASSAVARSTACLWVLLALAGAACRDGDGPAPAGQSTGAPAAAAEEGESRGVSLRSTSVAGLALEGLVIQEVTKDVVELRADLVNRGNAAIEVGELVGQLSGRAGEGAIALTTEDGHTRLYPLVSVAEPGEDRPQTRISLAPGARYSLVVRFGPLPAGLERLTPFIPGFTAELGVGTLNGPQT